MRNHSQVEQYIHSELGFNYRMEGLQGLVLGHKLPLVDGWTATRRDLARAYQERLRDLPLILPSVVNHDHVFHLYVVRTSERDRLRAHLLQHQIDARLHYPVPLHRQPCLAQVSEAPDSYPVAERYAKECLSLPLFIGMTEAQVDRVCRAIRRFFGQT
jgi:dTDP-4-amino-4,6-dideoxygalactose transaminase